MHAVRLDPGSTRSRHTGVLRRLRGCPDLEDAVVAHLAHSVVGFHRSVREIRNLVELVDRMGSFADRVVSVAFVAHDDGILSGLHEAAMLSEDLFGTASLRVAVVPADVQGLQPAMRVVEGLADNSNAFLDRHDRDDARHIKGGSVVDRAGGPTKSRRGEGPPRGKTPGPGTHRGIPVARGS